MPGNNSKNINEPYSIKKNQFVTGQNAIYVRDYIDTFFKQCLKLLLTKSMTSRRCLTRKLPHISLKTIFSLEWFSPI